MCEKGTFSLTGLKRKSLHGEGGGRRQCPNRGDLSREKGKNTRAQDKRKPWVGSFALTIPEWVAEYAVDSR